MIRPAGIFLGGVMWAAGWYDLIRVAGQKKHTGLDNARMHPLVCHEHPRTSQDTRSIHTWHYQVRPKTIARPFLDALTILSVHYQDITSTIP